MLFSARTMGWGPNATRGSLQFCCVSGAKHDAGAEPGYGFVRIMKFSAAWTG